MKSAAFLSEFSSHSWRIQESFGGFQVRKVVKYNSMPTCISIFLAKKSNDHRILAKKPADSSTIVTLLLISEPAVILMPFKKYIWMNVWFFTHLLQGYRNTYILIDRPSVAWLHFCRTQSHSPPNGDFCSRIWAS